MTEPELIHTFEKDEPVVSMIEHKGELWVATSYHIFKIINDKLEMQTFVYQPPPEE